MRRVRSSQSGQAALIALLVLTIATTVGLSLISRGTTNISVTRNIEESARAFSAAEAGVEEALRSGVASALLVDEKLGLTYAVSVASISGEASQPLVYQQKTPREETETIWLAPHNADGTVDDATPFYTSPSIDVCWSQESPMAAIVATVLYRETSDNSYRVAKAAYDPDPARQGVNKFGVPTATVGGCGAGTGTAYRQTMQFSTLEPTINPAVDVLIALRVRPVYNAALFAVIPLSTLPVQGRIIESVGTTESGVNRKIFVYQQHAAPATIFDNAIYSEGSINHE